MSGTTTAAVVIPIVGFCLLFAWLGLVFWADRHPVWGNSEIPTQASSRPVVLPDGSTIPRPRAEGQGAPQQPAQPGSAGRAGGR
jgi:hypothetical protein